MLFCFICLMLKHYLFLCFFDLFKVTFSATNIIYIMSFKIYLRLSTFCALLPNVCVLSEAKFGDGARLPAAADLQRQPTAGRVPACSTSGFLPRRLPAGHAAAHPVRLRHRQGRQAARHRHHQREQLSHLPLTVPFILARTTSPVNFHKFIFTASVLLKSIFMFYFLFKEI